MADESKSVMELVNAQPYSYCTYTKAKTYKHAWTVQNLHLCNSASLTSSEYSSGDDKKIKWKWQVNLKEKPDQPVLNLYLKFTHTVSPINFFANVELIKDQNKNSTFTFKGICTTGSLHWVFSCGRDLNVCVRLFNFKLTIVEDFKCGEDSMSVIYHSKLPNHWTNLLDDKEFADVTIVVSGEEFLAHKAVLASRSSVFRAMLKHKMVESTQNKVTITDIEPKVFEQLLHFIYTDAVENLDTAMAFDLLQAADKYDLEPLKTRCEATLCGQISEETAVNTLVLADLYRADQLRRAAIRFIGRNVGVIGTEEWKNLMLKNFDLANGVVMELLNGTQLK